MTDSLPLRFLMLLLGGLLGWFVGGFVAESLSGPNLAEGRLLRFHTGGASVGAVLTFAARRLISDRIAALIRALSPRPSPLKRFLELPADEKTSSVQQKEFRAALEGLGRDRATTWLPVLVGLMLLTGLFNVVLGVPMWMQLVHLVLADALWVAFVFVSARALQPMSASSPRLSSSR